MQHIYMQSNEHFEVFTTVFSPQVSRARHRYRHEEPDKVVVTHRYVPQWPDEVELTQGDVIHVLSKQEGSRWFGRLQNGQQGYFPASCVLELSHNVHHRDEASKNGRGLRRHSSVHVGSAELLGDLAGGGRPQAPRGGEEGPFLTLKHEAQASAPSSPSLLHRILSKHRRKSHCQGASNGAFEPD
ncbi:vexin [Salminus brasiliensis]|uniref:vexin n=1 Tax=Salminus brasiliensis TaxID=930266 RepID=UPI003B82FB83